MGKETEMLQFPVCAVMLHADHIGIKVQGNIRKGQKVFIAQNELIGDFLPFHYKVRDILYDLKTKINVQGVEQSQQGQQQGKVEEQIRNRLALKADQHSAAYEEEQTDGFFHKTGT